MGQGLKARFLQMAISPSGLMRKMAQHEEDIRLNMATAAANCADCGTQTPEQRG